MRRPLVELSTAPEVAVQGAGLLEPFSKPGLPRSCWAVPPEAVTVKETVAVCVIPPPVAVTVTVYVPADAVPAFSVSVELPEPGAAMDVVLKEAVAPEGRPEALSAIAELKPPETEVVSVEAAEEPCAALTLVGEAERVKAGVAVAVVTVTSSHAEYVASPE